MAGLSSLLYVARDALAAQSYGLNVAGQNVANANTPNYVRREAIIENVAVGSQTTGTVVASGLRRVADAFAEHRYYEANSNASAASQYDSELQQVEALFNDLNGVGLGDALSDIFKSFQQLAARPDDTTVRAELLDKVDVFASRARQTGDSLASQKTEMVSRAREISIQINERTNELAQLNQRIVQAKQAGSDASDLIDQRNAKLLNLSGLIDVKTIESQDGSILVQSAGTMLVEGSNARTLSVQLDSNDKIQILASRAGGSLPYTNVTAGLSGGQLAGIKQARDEDLFDVAERFDRFVFDIANSINAQHQQGVGLDGSTGLDLFDVGPTMDGSARAIRVSADVFQKPGTIAASLDAGDLPGGSDNAVLLGNLAEVTNIFGGRTPSQAYGDLVGEIGIRKASARSEVELRANIFQQAESVRDSISGVSLDEEMVNLQRFQRAYEAASKVFTTVDSLLEELMAMVGR